MTALMVIACSVVYLAVGLVLARRSYVSRYRSAWQEEWERVEGRSYYNDRERRELAEYKAKLDAPDLIPFWLIVWPLMLPIAPTMRWFQAPIVRDEKAAEERRERAKRLFADAKAWDAKRYEGTPEERAMAIELAKLCREQADEVERGSTR